MFENLEFYRIQAPDADLFFIPNWLEKNQASDFLSHLQTSIPWTQPVYNFYGKDVPMPRQVAWMGDSEALYSYSGLHHEPLEWEPSIQTIREKIQALTQSPINSVLLNRYRDNRDSVAWHSDNEAELGDQPCIVSLSIGATRTFALKPKSGDTKSIKLPLTHGSLLIMAGSTQQKWLHQVPKTTVACGERINCTFRNIVPLKPKSNFKF